MTRWIDTHVHLFPAPATDTPAMPHHGNRSNTPETYLSELGEDAPAGIVVVHFSKAETSQHVIGALDALKGKAPAVGVVKAVDPLVFDYILRDDIRAVRIYAKDGVPDFSNTQGWNRLWNQVRSRGKHILLFGDAPHLRKTVALLPQDIPLVIDHLGSPNAEKGLNDHEWQRLLADLKTRARHTPVYFKGPGYRTSLSREKVQPFVNAIIQSFGVDRLLLGASDAPFAGPSGEADPRYHNRPLGLFADLHWMRNYTRELARHAAQELGLDEAATVEKLLHANAAALYGF